MGYPVMKHLSRSICALHSRPCSGRGQVRSDCHDQASPRETRPPPGLGNRREIPSQPPAAWAGALPSLTLQLDTIPCASKNSRARRSALPAALLEVPPLAIIPPEMAGRAVCGGRGFPAGD